MTFESGGIPIVVVRAIDGAVRALRQRVPTPRTNVRAGLAARAPAASIARSTDGCTTSTTVISSPSRARARASTASTRPPRACGRWPSPSGTVSSSCGPVGDEPFDIDDWLAGLGDETRRAGLPVAPAVRAHHDHVAVQLEAAARHLPRVVPRVRTAPRVRSLRSTSASRRRSTRSAPTTASSCRSRRSSSKPIGRATSGSCCPTRCCSTTSRRTSSSATSTATCSRGASPLMRSTARASSSRCTRTSRSTREELRKHYDARLDAARSVTSDEDFPESERVHRNLASGVVDHTNAGRNEPGIIHFHRMLDAALAAMPADAPVDRRAGHLARGRRGSIR